MKNPVKEKLAIRTLLAFQQIDVVYIKQAEDCLAFKDDQLIAFSCESALMNLDKSLTFVFA